MPTSGGAGSRYTWADLHRDLVGQFTATGTTLAGSATYDPLGAVVAGSSMLGHLGYQSEWTESLTNRINMHARWYNVDTGQFDTRDTASNPAAPLVGSSGRLERRPDASCNFHRRRVVVHARHFHRQWLHRPCD